MPRVVHFEIMADDPERALRFYSDVFGWTGQKWDGPADYWLVSTGDDNETGINGGIGRTGDSPLDSRTVNTITVDSVDAFADKVTQHGGTVVMPKMAVPGVGYLVYCRDPEGIPFGIMQPDASAA